MNIYYYLIDLNPMLLLLVVFIVVDRVRVLLHKKPL
jgi:hypothetical protein